MDVAPLAVSGVLTILGTAVGLAVVRSRIRALENPQMAGQAPERLADEPLAIDELVHQLRVLQRQMSWVALGCGFLAAAVTAGSFAGSGRTAMVVITAALCMLVPTFAVRRPIVAAYARARGVPISTSVRRRRSTVQLIRLAVQICPIPVAVMVTPSAVGRAAVLAAEYVVISPLVLGLLAPVFAHIVGATELDAPTWRRVEEMSAAVGLRLRHARVIGARQAKIASAYLVGSLPGLRYVLVSDFLLDELTGPELDAVLAHEVAHGRLGHCLIRDVLGSAVFGALAIFDVSLLSRDDNPLVALGGLATALLIIRAYRRLTVRQEHAADDFAARIAGPAALAAALGKLSELNHLKPETTAKWDRSVCHPGIALRISRLQQMGLPQPVEQPT